MKLYQFPSENVHKRTGKTVIKVTTDVAFVGVCHMLQTGKVRPVLSFSAGSLSLACRRDVIFDRSLSYSLQFSDKNEISHREKVTRHDDRIHQSGKRLLKKEFCKTTRYFTVSCASTVWGAVSGKI